MKRLIQRTLLISALVLILLAGIAVVVAWKYRQSLLIAAGEWIESRILHHDIPAQPPVPDAARYELLSHQLEGWRKELSERHRKAQDAQTKAAVEDEARILLEHMLPAMMRCWIGTQWDFNGTAAKPGQGKIACGYFVSTVLRDAGLDVNRYRLAQQASANIIHTFINKNESTLTTSQDYDAFIQDMKQREPGVYICGLDTHVGFIVNQSDGFHFIHSSGAKPWTVVDESPQQAGVLQRSNWRMLGNLTANRDFIRTWITGEQIEVVR